MQAWLVAGGLRNPYLDPLHNLVAGGCASVFHKASRRPLHYPRNSVLMQSPLVAMMIVVNLTRWADQYLKELESVKHS